ncbi:protein kinase domain-containing protein [Oceanobacillus alkalisoli]|uniref:protein kinase domain-containing protein n=1 Tax=Oceanobacillus alkalisoli TaxID=2925113 RepID=UPI001EE3CE24|nr:serine/threonine-protein kinase [Oceanobacillus alkalisoli]MCG5105130.1 serine/threonine-protein kinase [Oceanobacillus alkalisoli]
MAMNRDWKKQVTSIPPGTLIQGKFKGNNYMMKRKLGEGAIGTVYLCQHGNQTAALKISEKQTSMTLEVNVLKALKQVRGNLLGPALLDVDDWLAPNGRTYTFYVMEYVQGESVQQFFRKNGASWLGLFMVQLLEDLEKLHEAGWVFGDLKTDNLLISQAPPRIRWIDVGGVTQIGRAIKEYTEFYDRGYWGLGSRRAEPSYDLFALAIIFLEIFYPQRFSRPETRRASFLFKKIDREKALQPYAPVLKKAITGTYTSSNQMKREVKQIIFSRKNQSKRETGKIGLLEAMWIFLFSILSILTSLCF